MLAGDVVVLIVAKCNVNLFIIAYASSVAPVLIVAKCNVNGCIRLLFPRSSSVLIVAKCNVNHSSKNKKRQLLKY